MKTDAIILEYAFSTDAVGSGRDLFPFRGVCEEGLRFLDDGTFATTVREPFEATTPPPGRRDTLRPSAAVMFAFETFDPFAGREGRNGSDAFEIAFFGVFRPFAARDAILFARTFRLAALTFGRRGTFAEAPFAFAPTAFGYAAFSAFRAVVFAFETAPMVGVFDLAVAICNVRVFGLNHDLPALRFDTYVSSAPVYPALTACAIDTGRISGGRNTDCPKSIMETRGGEARGSTNTLSPWASAWKMPRDHSAAKARFSWDNSLGLSRRSSMMSPRGSPLTMSMNVTKSLDDASYQAAYSAGTKPVREGMSAGLFGDDGDGSEDAMA